MAPLFRSFVSDLIDFKPTEVPKWRTGKKVLPCVKDMVRKIVNYQKEWRDVSVELDDNVIRDIERKFLYNFIHHCCVEEGHGCKTLEDAKTCLDQHCLDKSLKRLLLLSVEEQETINLNNAYQYLVDIKKEEKDEAFHGLMEESMLRETNQILLEGVHLPQHTTKPGVYSNQRRITEFNGEIYEYPKPEDMHLAVVSCLDKFNSLYQDAQSESDDEKKLEKLFKTCSWFIFEMLDLHPFGDGNGRLCRLLCSYVLSTRTPFPSSIHNIFSESCLDDFKEALVDARNSKDRHPCSLTTMIIESNYCAWKELMKEVHTKTPLNFEQIYSHQL
ncbi:uncharacterized protein [Asterias amurensis]|uniref:uncharacterized protein n=1 Tax=Asterias amurensis TaxID=7602 RepID=UPI003AB6092D